MLNKVNLIGHVGADPKVNETKNGVKVANFSLATTQRWTDKNSGEKREHTEWHRISCFDKIAETVEKYVTKGKKLFIEGEIKTRKYEKDGEDRWATEIKASKFIFLDSKSDSSDNDYSKGPKPKKEGVPGVDYQDDPYKNSDLPY